MGELLMHAYIEMLDTIRNELIKIYNLRFTSLDFLGYDTNGYVWEVKVKDKYDFYSFNFNGSVAFEYNYNEDNVVILDNNRLQLNISDKEVVVGYICH